LLKMFQKSLIFGSSFSMLSLKSKLFTKSIILPTLFLKNLNQIHKEFFFRNFNHSVICFRKFIYFSVERQLNNIIYALAIFKYFPCILHF
jgi:hypothetical protein